MRNYPIAAILILAVSLIIPQDARADVEICDGQGQCRVFSGPPCKDWSLAKTSTCRDLVTGMLIARAETLSGPLAVRMTGNAVVVATTDDEVVLVDLSAIGRDMTVGFSATIGHRVISPTEARVVVNLVASHWDPLEGVELSRRLYPIDVTETSRIEPILHLPMDARLCPAGLYPPKCYPCLGCEPCPGGGGFCSTTSIPIGHLPSNLTTTATQGHGGIGELPPTGGAQHVPDPNPSQPGPPTAPVGTVCTLVFMDANGNGRRERGEGLVPDVAIALQHSGGTSTITTDREVRCTNVSAGTVSLIPQLNSGLMPTTRASEARVGPGERIVIEIGVRRGRR